MIDCDTPGCEHRSAVDCSMNADAAEIGGLRGRLKEAETQRDFNAAVLEGRNPNVRIARGCPQCQTCGRDGHEGAVARHAALRLVRRAEVARDGVLDNHKQLQEWASQQGCEYGTEEAPGECGADPTACIPCRARQALAPNNQEDA